MISIYKRKLSLKAKKIGASKKKLAPMISQFIYYEEDGGKDEKYDYINQKVLIRELLKDKFQREVLTEILLDLYNDVSGEALQQLLKLYTDLGLQEDAYRKLNSWHWEVVAKGLLELSKMHVTEAYTLITKFINDRRGVVRKQAEIATVSLKKEGINFFLDTTKYKISEWQQLKLLDIIRGFEDYNPPRFRAWLTSENNTVVLFALRLIKFYDQNDANESIIELVKHKSNQVKSEAIKCIKEFAIFEARDTLKTIFEKANSDVKLLIVDSLTHLGKVEDIPILESIEIKDSSFIVRSKVVGAINLIAPGTKLPTEGIEKIEVKNFDDDNLLQDSQDPVEELFIEVTEESEALLPTDVPAEELISSIEETDVHEEKIVETLSDLRQEKNMDWLNAQLPTELETENEELFTICLMEELNDIMESFNSPEVDDIQNDSQITLDFLPIVLDKEWPIELKHTYTEMGQKIWNLNVDYELIKAKEESSEQKEKYAFTTSLQQILETLQNTEKGADMKEDFNIPSPDFSMVSDDDMDMRQFQGELFPDSDDDDFLKAELNEVVEPHIFNKEHEAIFDICFAQEFDDILKKIKESDSFSEKDDDVSIPLDFLPIVLDKDWATNIENTYTELGESLWDIPVIYETLEVTKKSKKNQQGQAAFIIALRKLLGMTRNSEKDSFSTYSDEESDDSYGMYEPSESADLAEFDVQSEVVISSGNEDIKQATHSEIDLADDQILDDIMNITEEVQEIPFDWDMSSMVEEIASPPQDNCPIHFKGFSIFQELCRNCDDESKLILLDEVLAVGEEKEVYFLNEQIAIASAPVRDKAIQIKKELLQKLQQQDK